MQVDTYRPRNKPRQRKQNDRERRGWIMSKHRPDWHCTQYERQVIETAEKTEASSDRRRRSRIRTGSDLDSIPNSWLHDPGHAWQRHVPYTECSSIAVHVSPQHCCCVQSRSSLGRGLQKSLCTTLASHSGWPATANCARDGLHEITTYTTTTKLLRGSLDLACVTRQTHASNRAGTYRRPLADCVRRSDQTR